MRRTTGRMSLVGSAYVPLDALARWIILGSTFTLVLVTVLCAGFAAFPIIVVAIPVSLGVAVMIARMGGAKWARLTAVLYTGVAFLLMGVFLTQSRWP